MRLININSFELEEFQVDDIPPYIILSHRWSRDEITFKDFLKGRRRDTGGYEKVRKFCEQIRLRETAGINHAWIDTVCIDKSSSAELSEAINSMWSYYQRASYCYVYLPDVEYPGVESPRTPVGEETRIPSSLDYFWGSRDTDQIRALRHMGFTRSIWFRRGWTLQELLAPRAILFLTQDWSPIGDTWQHEGAHSHTPAEELHGSSFASQKCLFAETSHASGIAQDILEGKRSIQQASIAERMSWLASRNTTRPEDIAYCALGLFNVNMPLLYGEGANAFLRLQEEIIKTSNDESVFTWPMDDVPYNRGSILASSPVDFFDRVSMRRNFKQKRIMPYAMTNQGLEIRLPQYSAAFSTTARAHFFPPDYGHPEIYKPFHSVLIPLNCTDKPGYPFIIALVEQECGHYDRQDGDQEFLRKLLDESMDTLQEPKTVYVHTPKLREACALTYRLDDEWRPYDPHRLEDILEEAGATGIGLAPGSHE